MSGNYPKIARHIGVSTLAFGLALFVFMGIRGAQGRFEEPLRAPPAGFSPPLSVTASTPQSKGSPPLLSPLGALGAQDFYVRENFRWMSQGPRIWIIQSFLDPSRAVCPDGYKLIGCSASRHIGVADNCLEEDCGFIGVMPIDSGGNITDQNPVGCLMAYDPGGPPVAHAYCMESR